MNRHDKIYTSFKRLENRLGGEEMIHSVLTNDILKQIVNIEENRFDTDATVIPEVSRDIGVANKTVINRCAALARNGYMVPVMIKKRVRTYRMSDYTIENGGRIIEVTEERRRTCAH